MAILPKAVYRFYAISIKKSQWHYSQKQKKDRKIYVEQQKITESQSHPEQKNKVGGISVLDFKT